VTTPDENVEALRRLFELVGDGENPDALYALLDPEVVFVIPAGDLEGGEYRGHDGVRRYFRRWAGTWETWHFRPKRFEVIDEHRVAVDLFQRGRGKGSGVEVENRPGQLWTFRDGVVVRWENFASFEEALSAAGPG
jgi:ketosteroid isomerase-like protein